MAKEKKLDLSKTLMELAAECWTGEDLFAAFKKQLDGEQKNIEQTTSQKPEEETLREPLTQRITNILREIGIPANILGYSYLRYGIELAIKESDILNQMTKGLYPNIVTKFGSTGSRVERAIRHAVEAAFDRGSMEAIEKYFSNAISCHKGKATNKEFIAMVVDHLRLEGYETDQ